jgi:hypothetical protein
MKIHAAVSEFIYIYIYIYMCVCMCVCSDGRTDSLILIDASQVYKRVYIPEQ